MIDTHTHLDGKEFTSDRAEVISRAKAASVERVFIPAINYKSCHSVVDFCREYEGYAYPMLGLHPEEVKADYREQLDLIHQYIADQRAQGTPVLAIGEIGLDYYWSREFEKEQLDAFRTQVEWAVEMQLPLMIHCRKGQNEMVRLLDEYRGKLPGGVFHCFTGNEKEAEQLLQFDNFVLGIGGVLTFKKSHLPEVLAATVPLERIVLETDSPYMAPVPMRGNRNESAYVKHVLEKLADTYGLPIEKVDRITTATASRVFGL